MDGGARGNPGPAAAAAVVSAPGGEVLAEAAERIGTATNNVAEYRGLLLGVEKARELGATEVEIVNDSELIAKQVSGEYKVKHPDMKPLHAAAMEALNRVRALVDPLRAARAERRRRRAREPGARRTRRRGGRPAAVRPGANAAREPTGGTDYSSYLLIDDLLSLQRPITAGRARRAAVHRRPPELRAVVQADPARARAGARRPAGAPARTSRRRGCGGSSRSSGCCSSTSTCWRPWAPTASSSSATRWRPRRASSRSSSAASSGSPG